MDEQRIQAYLGLIQRLLECPSGEESQILNEHPDLVDRDLVQVMRGLGSQLVEQGQEQTASFLGQIADQLDRVLGAPSEDQFRFLMQLLQTTQDTDVDRQAVYGVMRERLDLLDERIIELLRSWGEQALANAEADQARGIAAAIGTFSNLIQQFPLGNRSINFEIAIVGYELVLRVFDREGSKTEYADRDLGMWIHIHRRLAQIRLDHIRGDYQASIQRLEEARRLITSSQKELDQLPSVMFELGRLYHRTGSLDQARLYFKDALRLYQRHNLTERISATLTALGNLEMQTGRIDQAHDHLQEALEIYSNENNQEMIAEVSKLLEFVREAQLSTIRL